MKVRSAGLSLASRFLAVGHIPDEAGVQVAFFEVDDVFKQVVVIGLFVGFTFGGIEYILFHPISLFQRIHKLLRLIIDSLHQLPLPLNQALRNVHRGRLPNRQLRLNPLILLPLFLVTLHQLLLLVDPRQ